jgi:hypothetical protein
VLLFSSTPYVQADPARQTTERSKPIFSSKYKYYQKLQDVPGGLDWTVHHLDFPGTECDEQHAPKAESLDLYTADIVEAVRQLIGNPAFAGELRYHAEPVYEVDHDGRWHRKYDEMSSGDWWRKIEVNESGYSYLACADHRFQARLPGGSTVVPVVISTDKTALTSFAGGKQAWPVYLTIGNLPKELRRKPSSHATLLIGYLPVSKMAAFKKADRAKANANLFHYCMGKILAPLRQAGSEGVLMGCADGRVRHCYLILAAYVADNPEQCLIACCKNTRCHRCVIPSNRRGEYVPPGHRARDPDFAPRNPDRAANDLFAKLHETTTDTFGSHGLTDVEEPFWAHLPHTDIFVCLTPDLLHQVHRGVFKDHILEWCRKILGNTEIDRRFSVLPDHPTARHFYDGISGLSQTSGKEHKNMEKPFAAVVHGRDDRITRAASALLDFIELASLPAHTEMTLTMLEDALARFHADKDVFFDLGGREIEGFDLNKLHSLLHYAEAIRLHGALDGYNTEWSERLHIDYAKKAYQASNRVGYTSQMTKWLNRRAKVIFFQQYFAWLATVSVAPSSLNDSLLPDNTASEDSADSALASTADSPASGPRSRVALPLIRGQVIAARPDARFLVAKTAPWPSCSADGLRDSFGCARLLPALEVYLATRSIDPSLLREDDTFSVFTRLNIRHVHSSTLLGVNPPDECIRAGPGSPFTAASSAAFDTILTFKSGTGSTSGSAAQGTVLLCHNVRSDSQLMLMQYTALLAFVRFFSCQCDSASRLPSYWHMLNGSMTFTMPQTHHLHQCTVSPGASSLHRRSFL